MAWRIVKQPNGKLARFSDVVDNFTDYDMSEQEAIDLCLTHTMGLDVAIQKVRAGIEDWKPWTNGIKGSGHDRWDDCIKTIRWVHGDKEAEDVIKLLGGKT